MLYLNAMFSRGPEHTGESLQVSLALGSAAHDYRWLLDRDYPDTQSLRLVGDRYRLSGTERGMLYRGVFSEQDSRRRAARLSGLDTQGHATPNASDSFNATGTQLTVDGHNVLFTIWNYLSGRPIVLATDGWLRDIGGTRARLPHDERFTRVATLLLEALKATRCNPINILLDEQLPWSRDHCTEINALHAQVSHTGAGPAASKAPTLTATTNSSVDAAVAATGGGSIATSDTGIIDRCKAPVLDLGGYIVLQVLEGRPLHMTQLCKLG